MRWFKRRKKEPEYSLFTSEIPVTTMVRWFIYDLGHGEDGIDDFLGLLPVSEEGSTKEFQDSETRLKAIAPLIPYIESMSEISSTVLSVLALHSVEDEDLPIDEDLEDVAEMLKSLYKSISMSSIVGSLSVAAALGLIQINAVTSDLKEVNWNGDYND